MNAKYFGMCSRLSRRTIALIISGVIIASFLSGKADDAVSLSNRDGKTIVASIVEATNQKVFVKRSSDGRAFTLDRAKLNPESMDKVSEWEKNRLVSHHKYTVYRGFEGKSQTPFEVSLSLPNGPFVIRPRVPSSSPTDMVIRFDNTEKASTSNKTGEIHLDIGPAVVEHFKTPEKFRDHHFENEAKQKKNLTPKEAAELDKKTKLEPIICGKFSGFFLPVSKIDPPNPEREKRFFLTNGDYFIYGSMKDWDNGPMNPNLLKKVLGTVEVRQLRTK